MQALEAQLTRTIANQLAIIQAVNDHRTRLIGIDTLPTLVLVMTLGVMTAVPGHSPRLFRPRGLSRAR